MPLTRGAMDFSQSGSVMALRGSSPVTGHDHGTSGAVGQEYVEYMAGEECYSNNAYYTSADNTTGTKFFPDTAYFVSLFNISRSQTGGVDTGVLYAEIMAKSFVPSNEDVSLLGYSDYSRYVNAEGVSVYRPEADPSEFFHIYYADAIYGKFSRVAVYRTPAAVDYARIIITKGQDRGHEGDITILY